MLSRHRLPDGLTLLSPTVLIATVGGSGFVRPASGTFGTLAALPFSIYLLFNYSPLALLSSSIALFIIGLIVCTDWTRKQQNHAGLEAEADATIEHDPSMIVIDEAAGIFLTLAFAPPTLAAVIAGFVLFRLFDISKPWPVSWADRRLKGPMGVMLDDMIAGLMAGLLIFAATQIGVL
jgi:phosphatidylglycerophosphatase A